MGDEWHVHAGFPETVFAKEPVLSEEIAVIAGKEDDRVIVLSDVLEGLNDVTDAEVDLRYASEVVGDISTPAFFGRLAGAFVHSPVFVGPARGDRIGVLVERRGQGHRGRII